MLSSPYPAQPFRGRSPECSPRRAAEQRSSTRGSPPSRPATQPGGPCGRTRRRGVGIRRSHHPLRVLTAERGVGWGNRCTPLAWSGEYTSGGASATPGFTVRSGQLLALLLRALAPRQRLQRAACARCVERSRSSRPGTTSSAGPSLSGPQGRRTGGTPRPAASSATVSGDVASAAWCRCRRRRPAAPGRRRAACRTPGSS